MHVRCSARGPLRFSCVAHEESSRPQSTNEAERSASATAGEEWPGMEIQPREQCCATTRPTRVFLEGPVTLGRYAAVLRNHPLLIRDGGHHFASREGRGCADIPS